MKIVENRDGYQIRIPETVEEVALLLSEHYTERFYDESTGAEWAMEDGWETLWEDMNDNYEIQVKVSLVKIGGDK